MTAVGTSRDAIVSDGTSYVMQAVGGTAKKVAVRVLAAANAEDVIAGPLDPTAPIALAGSYQLTAGMKIRAAEPPPPTTR